MDFSDCRTKLTRHEVVTILLDTPANKAAGPDGIPGEILKRYNWELSEVFMEAWEELTESSAGDTTQAFQELIEEMLGRKKWHAAQKVPGANRTEKLRDIDVGNTVRRTIATMLATVLRDVCSREIHEAQQAFLPSRNIMKNTTLLLRTYGDARTASDGGGRDAENREDIPLLLLLLDCSKGYNRMLRKWIIRCLKRAKTPPKIIRLVKILMINIPILFLNGSEYGTAETDSGLSQGCIAACLLYIIGVDPLIAKLAARKQQHNPSPDTDTDDDGTPRHRPPRSLTPPANVGDSRAHAPAALGGGPDREILGTPAREIMGRAEPLSDIGLPQTDTDPISHQHNTDTHTATPISAIYHTPDSREHESRTPSTDALVYHTPNTHRDCHTPSTYRRNGNYSEIIS